MSEAQMRHPVMFEEFPQLGEKLPWISLGDYPTPLEKSEAAAAELGAEACYAKRDDKSSPLYGGNKVRKLEFLVADAQQKGSRTIITFGALGSNHLLATSVHGRRLGFRVVGCLVPQPVSAHMKRNLLLNVHYGTQLELAASEAALPGVALNVFLKAWRQDGAAPYVVTFGGSSVLGCVGFVNAAFELREQCKAMGIAPPDYLFTALGSNGTVAGLTLGCRAAGLPTKVMPVLVSNYWMCNPVTLTLLCRQVNALLRKHDPSFPDCDIRVKDIVVDTDHRGEAYARYTEGSVAAVRDAERLFGLHIEGTYTGKAFAGMTDFCRKNNVKGKSVVFWNTYNSVDLSGVAATADPAGLPKGIRMFFDMPNQPLDYES